jgi:hypothetical protein
MMSFMILLSESVQIIRTLSLIGTGTDLVSEDVEWVYADDTDLVTLSLTILNEFVPLILKKSLMIVSERMHMNLQYLVIDYIE